MRVGERRICTLAYADNVVVLAESMMRRIEEYFEKRKLKANVGKTKVMRFRRE